METKDDLEEKLNEVLDTEMEWSKMKKDDLELLWELIDNGVLMEPVAKHQVKQHGKEKYEEMVDDWRPGKFITKVL